MEYDENPSFPEEPLPGAFSTLAKVGNTVRRSMGPLTPAVHALLRHLETAGLDGAPRVPGVDTQLVHGSRCPGSDRLRNSANENGELSRPCAAVGKVGRHKRRTASEGCTLRGMDEDHKGRRPAPEPSGAGGLPDGYRRGVSDRRERLAWLVLRAVNRTQAKGSTVRLAIPRDTEVSDELGLDVTEEQLLSAEEYLEDRGYLERADISLTMGTYTITPVGLKWLETVIPGRPEAYETVKEQQGWGQSHPEAPRAQVGAKPRSWWRRMVGR